MRCRRRGKKRCPRRYCPTLASRSREAANRAGPRARAAALAFVRRFALGDALLQLAPRFTRCRASGVECVRNPPLLVVDGVQRRLDTLLNGGANFLELVRDGPAHVLDESLRRILRAPGTAGDFPARLFTALWSEQERQSGAKRGPHEKRSDTRFASLDDHVRLVDIRLVIIVPLVLVHSILRAV